MGKRLIIKGADFSTHGMNTYKFVPVTTSTIPTRYTNNKLNVIGCIDVSKITANTEYYIKVTSRGNKFKSATLVLITGKDSTYKYILEFNIENYASFKVENIPDNFILQTIEDIYNNNTNGDDTLTIGIYKKQELV